MQKHEAAQRPVLMMDGMHSMMILGWVIGALLVVLLIVLIAKLLRK